MAGIQETLGVDISVVALLVFPAIVVPKICFDEILLALVTAGDRV